jgi:hypothetical protein
MARFNKQKALQDLLCDLFRASNIHAFLHTLNPSLIDDVPSSQNKPVDVAFAVVHMLEQRDMLEQCFQRLREEFNDHESWAMISAVAVLWGYPAPDAGSAASPRSRRSSRRPVTFALGLAFIASATIATDQWIRPALPPVQAWTASEIDADLDKTAPMPHLWTTANRRATKISPVLTDPPPDIRQIPQRVERRFHLPPCEPGLKEQILNMLESRGNGRKFALVALVDARGKLIVRSPLTEDSPLRTAIERYNQGDTATPSARRSPCIIRAELVP